MIFNQKIERMEKTNKMETRESYEITLIPIVDETRVMFDGEDYTTAAQEHRLTLGGRNYYIRQNGSWGKLSHAISVGLELIFSNLGEVNDSIRISISRLETRDPREVIASILQRYEESSKIKK